MTHLLGRQDCVESLRRDLIDLQGTVVDIFSRTGPVRFPSWKFPDKLSCNLDLVSLLDQYDYVDGEEDFNQHAHLVLMELVIDRLLLLLQSFNAHVEQLRVGQNKEHIQPKVPCVSIGLVVRHYWKNLIQLGNTQMTTKQVSKEEINSSRSEENTTLASSLQTTKSDFGLQSASIVSLSTSRTIASTPICPPQNRTNGASSCPPHKTSSAIPLCHAHISADTHNVSCQTVESSLVPCDACAQVQSSLRATGDALVELCRSEGIPCSLQHLLVAVDETLERGRLTAGDVAQWSTEQCRDMGRLGKHLLEVRATVQPLRESLKAAQGEREEFRAQLGRAQEKLKCEKATHQTSKEQLEKMLQDAEASRAETERRLQEEHEELRRGALSLEDSISKLKTEISFQQEKSHKLESEKDKLHQEAKALQIESEARIQLEEKTQMLETQLCATQLLLDKANSKYQNACRQQESLQAKQKSLLERLDFLDQEFEELQGQLDESEGRQTELQDRLTHISEERNQLQTKLTQEQALCSKLQQDKQILESHVIELKTSADQLRGEVQELTQRERMLVAFPELNPLPEGPPQSTGDVLEDMEQQLQTNCVRIRVLEQENGTLTSTLKKLRNRAQLVSTDVGSRTTSPSSRGFSQPLHVTPRDGQLYPNSDVHHSPLQSSGAGASSRSATTCISQTRRPATDTSTSAVRSYEKIRQAARPRSVGMHQRRK
ncbi:hypothetical protein DPEC_G00262730 [Dallia pectoralis]|uniref:Uncharacterized protein n=1 Tax=Dallia pectoralis TaxID=75939 RepID=A0ACC2FS32_DALPE|nr:hypothetical protein DPEC_G00262730 [Dallia pectoralis]